MKQKIILFLQNLPKSKFEQFNEAFALYGQLPNKNTMQERAINRSGYSDSGLKNLLYDLQQLVGIKDVELHKVIPIVPTTEEKTEEKQATESVNDIKVNGAEVVSFDKPIREEFPFLNEKDCPEVLLVVVGKKMTAYKLYQAAHSKLEDIENGTLTATEEEQSALAKEVEENYRENIALWDELNYYAQKHEFLGKHALFTEINSAKEVEFMKMDDLFKYRNSSAKFFTDKKKLLVKHAENLEKVAEINAQIKEREYKLDLVNQKINAK